MIFDRIGGVKFLTAGLALSLILVQLVSLIEGVLRPLIAEW
jgi:hypothetical protein